MNRTVKATGETLPVSLEVHQLNVTTRIPSKYLLVDTETGQVYQGSAAEGKSWVKLPVDNTVLDQFVQHVFEEKVG